MWRNNCSIQHATFQVTDSQNSFFLKNVYFTPFHTESISYFQYKKIAKRILVTDKILKIYILHNFSGAGVCLLQLHNFDQTTTSKKDSTQLLITFERYVGIF